MAQTSGELIDLSAMREYKNAEAEAIKLQQVALAERSKQLDEARRYADATFAYNVLASEQIHKYAETSVTADSARKEAAKIVLAFLNRTDRTK